MASADKANGTALAGSEIPLMVWPSMSARNIFLTQCSFQAPPGQELSRGERNGGNDWWCCQAVLPTNSNALIVIWSGLCCLLSPMTGQNRQKGAALQEEDLQCLLTQAVFLANER